MTRRGRSVQVGDICYRSNAEALWGEYLIELGLEPEHEGFFVAAGRQSYLPDFYVPSLNTVIEVKRGHVTMADIAKWRAALVAFEERVEFVVLDGVPPGRWHLVITRSTIPDTIPALARAWVYGRWPEIPWEPELFRRAKDRVNAHADAVVRPATRTSIEFDQWVANRQQVDD